VCGEIEAGVFDCRGDSAPAQVRGVFGEDDKFGHGDDGVVGLGSDEIFPALWGLLGKKLNISIFWPSSTGEGGGGGSPKEK